MSLPGVSEDWEEYEDNVFCFSIKHALPPLDLSFKSLLTADGMIIHFLVYLPALLSVPKCMYFVSLI